MANQLSPELLAQLFAQESDDPFLTLVTLTHEDFDTIRLVNNKVDIVSRGNTFKAFGFKVRLPTDDGESLRDYEFTIDNVTRELITATRSVTTPIGFKLEMILASMPDEVQISVEDLLLQNVNYNKNRLTAHVILDNILNTEMTSEKYMPGNFRGIF